MPPHPSASDGRPDWLLQALALEAEDRLEQAEETITQAVQHLGAAATIAQMYASRMLRLQRDGDLPGARAAFEKAEQWIYYYASQATSGGEGVALSRERDEFLAQLRGSFAG